MVCVVQDSWKELERFQSLYQEAAKSDEFLLSRLHDPEFAAATKLLAASRQVGPAQDMGVDPPPACKVGGAPCGEVVVTVVRVGGRGWRVVVWCRS